MFKLAKSFVLKQCVDTYPVSGNSRETSQALVKIRVWHTPTKQVTLRPNPTNKCLYFVSTVKTSLFSPQRPHKRSLAKERRNYYLLSEPLSVWPGQQPGLPDWDIFPAQYGNPGCSALRPGLSDLKSDPIWQPWLQLHSAYIEKIEVAFNKTFDNW